MNKETEAQIRELQSLEQNLQGIIMQKQAMQLELSEIENAIGELSKAKDEVYKVAGNIMIKSNKENVLKDLKEKKDIIALRMKTLDSQEKSLAEKSESLREKVLSQIKS